MDLGQAIPEQAPSKTYKNQAATAKRQPRSRPQIKQPGPRKKVSPWKKAGADKAARDGGKPRPLWRKQVQKRVEYLRL